MNVTDLLLMIVILAIIGGAVFYIVKEKKRGTKCIGCPAAGGCPRNKHDCCSKVDQ